MRRPPLVLVTVVTVLVALTGVLNVRSHPHNVQPGTSGPVPGAQSSALYCTGLTNARNGLRGEVVYINTTDQVRHVVVHAVATGATSAVATAFTLPAYGRQPVTPTNLVVGATYALSAQIDGGGVVADQVVTASGASAPCTSAGLTNWYGSGFDSTVGSSAVLSIYNPTATAAVFNVTTFSKTGFLSPAALQGVSVGAHAELTLNLGDEVVATQNFGAQVSVLRGSLVVVEDQIERHGASINPGSTQVATSGVFPLVSTADKVLAQLRVANPGPAQATVTFEVKLKGFTIAPQTTVVAPYHSTVVTITPNTAIPAAGEALVRMSSTQAVDVTLGTGVVQGLHLSPLASALQRPVLADVTGRGFAQATLTNVGRATSIATWSLIRQGRVVSTGSTQVTAGASVSLGQLLGGRDHLRGATLVISGTSATWSVSATLETSPAGQILAPALNGG